MGEEVTIGLLEDTEVLGSLQLSKDDVRMLHATLDAEGLGKVPVGEFLFGVLKLAGTKSIDMLGIDYRQKVLLRHITVLERTSMDQMHTLGDALQLVCNSANLIS